MAELPICRYLDHAVLKPQYTTDEARAEIQAGIDLNVRTVCVRPCDVDLARPMCDGTETDLCVVLGFPHGCQMTASKADEARRYIDMGVDEIDMVINYGWAKSGQWDRVAEDIAAVSSQTRPGSIVLKTIFETCYLTAEQIRKATDVAAEFNADFVKTSTGFADHGATAEAVSAMLDAAAGRVGVKASGGIRDRQTAERYLEMGCLRLGVGSGSSAAICKGGRSDEAY